MRAASAQTGAYTLEKRVVRWGPGEARTGRDEASRRGWAGSYSPGFHPECDVHTTG
jgi:hypothetical protein